MIYFAVAKLIAWVAIDIDCGVCVKSYKADKYTLPCFLSIPEHNLILLTGLIDEGVKDFVFNNNSIIGVIFYYTV